jgi:hypothetical protein
MLDDGYKSDLERAQSLQNILIATATGSRDGNASYKYLRAFFIDIASYNDLLPGFVRINRELDQFWQFIKEKFPSYAERRSFVWKEFTPLIDYLEGKSHRPLDKPTSETLKAFDQQSIHAVWQRALDRRTNDPEGAITAARTLLETVCKHILDIRSITYDANKVELHELYKLTAKVLELSPSQHTEEVFKQILGGCSAIVSGLGTLRNRLGDAHGKGHNSVYPAIRHAELAVNLAGSVSLFLVSTWHARNEA